MRLVSYRIGEEEGYGVVTDGGIVACAPLTGGAAPTLRSALEQGLLEQLPGLVAGRSADVALSDVQLLPPIPNPSKIFCAGVNYADHRDEASRPKVDHPTIFTRFADSQVGHEQDVVRPTASTKLDYEGEVAVVIGKRAFHVSTDEAMDYLAGYSCYDDVSVRDWQRHSSQWIPGKNFFGVGSFGPWLVTTDEIGDPQLISLETRVNGEVRQSAPVKDMLFPIPDLISYISTFSPLAPGDVIVTGTPGGVGVFRDPPLFLQPGDVVEVEVTGVGVLRNRIAEA